MTTILKGARVIGVAHNPRRRNDFFTLGMTGTSDGASEYVYVTWDDGTKSLCWIDELENTP